MTCSLPTALWAAQVAAATPLPDARLHARLERLLTHLALQPLDSLPQALPDCHQAKAAYRFFANDRVERDDLLEGWRATTAQAVRGRDVIYVAHDTTTFSYTSLKQTSGLGYISDVEAGAASIATAPWRCEATACRWACCIRSTGRARSTSGRGRRAGPWKTRKA